MMGIRDSNKPPVRGKTSPYGFFVKMCYEEHKKKYPNENVQVTEISKKCSEKWKTMTDDEKRRFFELAQKDAERYAAEIAAYGGEDAMRKRKRAKKDPNAPKRALSAFFFFSQMKRPEVQAAHTEWKVGQVAQELGRMWKALTEEEKKVYEKMAYDDKHRYEAEMKDYKAGRKPGSSTPQQQQQQQQQPGTAMQQQQPQMQQMHMQQQRAMPVQQMQQGMQMPIHGQNQVVSMQAAPPAPAQQQQQQQQPMQMQQTNAAADEAVTEENHDEREDDDDEKEESGDEEDEGDS